MNLYTLIPLDIPVNPYTAENAADTLKNGKGMLILGIAVAVAVAAALILIVKKLRAQKH